MDKNELLLAIENVKAGVESKGIVEGMTYFLFDGNCLVSYNDKISIRSPLKTDFTTFVKAVDLQKLVNKIKSDTINVVFKDDKLHISSKNIRASLSTIFDEDIQNRIASINKSLKKSKWRSLPSNFSECISLCSYFASNQESEGTLTCVYVNGHNIAATDNIRVARTILDGTVKPMFIKASEVRNLININPAKYYADNTWLHFKNENGCIFSIRKIQGEFPNIKNLFEFDGDIIKLPKEVMNGLDITSIFTDSDNPYTHIAINNNTCIVSVKSESGTVKYRTKVKYTGNPIKFVINPKFLQEMMQHSTKMIISIDRIMLKTENTSIVTALMQ